MIVPRNRLLFWVGAVAAPLTLLAAAVPHLAPLCVALLVMLGAVALADALRAPGSIAGIGAQFPPVIRMSKDREGKVEVRIQNPRKIRRGIRIGLGLPEEVIAATPEQEVILPPDAEWSQLTWNCTPRMRGRFRAGPLYVEGASPWGMWSIRQPILAETEIRVYPDLMTERKSLASFLLRRGIQGFHLQRQIGKGRDFEKLREYVPGDSFEDIHWKATARRARPITKVFQIERTQEVYVVVDASRLSARRQPSSDNASGGPPILERMVTAALVLGLAAQQQGDLFGLITYTDRVETFVRAKNGKAHYNLCRDALYTLQPRIVTPDFGELYTFIRLRLRRRALIIFLTSLDDPALAESFVRSVELIRRQHLLLVNMIRQPGIEPLFSSPNVESIDDIYRGLGGHLRWQKLRQLEKTLHRRGVRFSLIDNERLSADLVNQYLNIKQKQLL